MPIVPRKAQSLSRSRTTAVAAAGVRQGRRQRPFGTSLPSAKSTGLWPGSRRSYCFSGNRVASFAMSRRPPARGRLLAPIATLGRRPARVTASTTAAGSLQRKGRPSLPRGSLFHGIQARLVGSDGQGARHPWSVPGAIRSNRYRRRHNQTRRAADPPVERRRAGVDAGWLSDSPKSQAPTIRISAYAASSIRPSQIDGGRNRRRDQICSMAQDLGVTLSAVKARKGAERIDRRPHDADGLLLTEEGAVGARRTVRSSPGWHPGTGRPDAGILGSAGLAGPRMIRPMRAALAIGSGLCRRPMTPLLPDAKPRPSQPGFSPTSATPPDWISAKSADPTQA
jgi:hypothetical protein